MKSEKMFVWLTIWIICSLFLFVGCEPAAKDTAQARVETEQQIEYPVPVLVEKFVKSFVGLTHTFLILMRTVERCVPPHSKIGHFTRYSKAGF